MPNTKSKVAMHAALSLAALLLSAERAAAEPLPIPTLHSTGFDASGARLFTGEDPHYTLLRVDSTASWDGTNVPVFGPSYQVFDPPIHPLAVPTPHPAWVPNGDASGWISLEGSWGWSQFSQGIYTYQTTFDLTGLDPETVRIAGVWGTDDPGWAYLNLDDPTVLDPARLVIDGGGFGVLPGFEIRGTNGLFRPGLNTLTFVVWDGGNCVTGLRFEVRSATAEPLLPVGIDVMPGTSPNLVNLGATGELPVAILSAPGFAATELAAGTVTVGKAHVVRRKDGSYKVTPEDVNGDGVADLVVKVLTSDLGITASATELVVDGFTNDGLHVRGSDAIVVVK